MLRHDNILGFIAADNKDDGTYKAELKAEVGTSSLNEEGGGSGTYEKVYQWIIKATPEQAANDKDTFMVSEIGLKLINFLTKASLYFIFTIWS